MTESAPGSACGSVIGADEQPDEPEQQPYAERKDDEEAAGKPKKQKTDYAANLREEHNKDWAQNHLTIPRHDDLIILTRLDQILVLNTPHPKPRCRRKASC
jgi:hypothetical protein